MALPAAAKLLVFIPRLGKEGPNHPVMEIKNFIGERGGGFHQDGHQCGVTAFNLILLELEDSGLSAFSRQTQQPILMNLSTAFDGDPDGPDLLKPFYMR